MNVINIKNTLPKIKRVSQLGLKTTEVLVSEGAKAIPAVMVGTATKDPFLAAATYCVSKTVGDFTDAGLRISIAKIVPKDKEGKVLFGNPLNHVSTLILFFTKSSKDFVKFAKKMYKNPY